MNKEFYLPDQKVQASRGSPQFEERRQNLVRLQSEVLPALVSFLLPSLPGTHWFSCVIWFSLCLVYICLFNLDFCSFFVLIFYSHLVSWSFCSYVTAAGSDLCVFESSAVLKFCRIMGWASLEYGCHLPKIGDIGNIVLIELYMGVRRWLIVPNAVKQQLGALLLGGRYRQFFGGL